MRDFLRAWLLLSVVWTVACGPGGSIPTATSTTTTGTGGGHSNPCGDVDCSGFKTKPCTVAVCNTGQVDGGPLNTCIEVPAPEGTSCDDGKFCTVDDYCDQGVCIGGPPNDCGKGPVECNSVICYEASQTCSDPTPANDGTACTPTDLCQIDGVCTVGVCVGVGKDCSTSPQSECNLVSCDKTTGDCVANPDSNLNGNPCLLTGDLCNSNKACLNGQCVGGTPTDCTLLNVQCQVGTCDSTTGLCNPTSAPPGTACTHGVQECQHGTCDVTGNCMAAPSPDGTACNDHDACTQGDTCTGGACAGAPVTGCARYFSEGFETCPDGWTLMGDWQCGEPTNTSPVTPFDGQNVLATQLDGLYHDNQTVQSCYASSPTIDLTQAQHPQLSFWAWVWTADNGDGCNLSVSTDAGQTFNLVTTVSPAYSQTVYAQPAWGGDFSTQGWQPYSADLTAWAGSSIILQFGFGSNLTGVAPGFYVDDLVVAEPLQTPLYITTSSPLANGYAGKLYSTTITKVGGTGSSVWSVNPGGGNDSWLMINSATGVLSGTPSAAETGLVTVSVHVQEAALPSNYADLTFTFDVLPDVYYTSFEGSCPDGWTLTGDWHCGVPKNMSTGAPSAAYDGMQCIGTGMSQDYSDGDTWPGTTATSPPISLAGVQSPTLTFRMWVDTEGGTYDGANLKISTDGGATYAVLNSVTPPYPLTIGNEPAWGGDQSALQWQLVQADLSAYSGMTILLRFGFQSDASGTSPGVFIDDFLIE